MFLFFFCSSEFLFIFINQEVLTTCSAGFFGLGGVEGVKSIHDSSQGHLINARKIAEKLEKKKGCDDPS